MSDLPEPTEPTPPPPVVPLEDPATVKAREDAEIAALQARLKRVQALLSHSPSPPTPEPSVGKLLDFRSIAARLTAHASNPARRADLDRRAQAAEARSLLVLAREREIPEDQDLRDVVFDADPPPTRALEAFREAFVWREACRREGAHRGCIVMVGGSVGVGKSCAMCWALLRAELSALYVQAPDVTATPKNTFSENLHRWARWHGVPVLGLDDLGTEGGDPEAMASLLWQRYDRGRCTLVTTNLSRRVIVERYFSGEIGRRLADRLVNAQGRVTGATLSGEGGLPWYVTSEGESLRNVEARERLRRGEAR